MYLDVYIGDLDDPNFDWNDNSGTGLNPFRKSPFFPGGQLIFSKVQNKIMSDFGGKQHDWGAWVGKATKKQIEELMVELYQEDWYFWLDQLRELKAFVDKLDSKKQYALVASEL